MHLCLRNQNFRLLNRTIWWMKSICHKLTLKFFAKSQYLLHFFFRGNNTFILGFVTLNSTMFPIIYPIIPEKNFSPICCHFSLIMMWYFVLLLILLFSSSLWSPSGHSVQSLKNPPHSPNLLILSLGENELSVFCDPISYYIARQDAPFHIT